MVGVDRPIKALSMHIQKPYKGIIVKTDALVISALILKTLLLVRSASSRGPDQTAPKE